ncbi:hypothetical protein [Treponema sp. OMZ 788]|uniref:hypothetical protein n=1 Tax=Treponema sp. OMZ 788 TaxID=2563664 RepID=UPI0020A38BC6|nr:hypothetical protein [Treponema sp. OMZ 788]
MTEFTAASKELHAVHQWGIEVIRAVQNFFTSGSYRNPKSFYGCFNLRLCSFYYRPISLVHRLQKGSSPCLRRSLYLRA